MREFQETIKALLVDNTRLAEKLEELIGAKD
jgi:hypothetical protein